MILLFLILYGNTDWHPTLRRIWTRTYCFSQTISQFSQVAYENFQSFVNQYVNAHKKSFFLKSCYYFSGKINYVLNYRYFIRNQTFSIWMKHKQEIKQFRTKFNNFSQDSPDVQSSFSLRH